MKSAIRWFYLICASISQQVYSTSEGLVLYREGHYAMSAKALDQESLRKDPIANYYLGRMRLYGYGELRNNDLAMHYFNQAAEKGILPAQQFLARYQLLEEKNPSKALYWFAKSASLSDVTAQMYCSAAYLFGYGTDKKPDLANRYIISAAKSGNAIAQFTLATQFLESRDLRNKKLGLIWLNKAVLQGFPKAEFSLANIYMNGVLEPKDEEKAKILLNKSANHGYSPAMNTLAKLAIAQNLRKTAEDWLKKAAILGDTESELALAEFYAAPNLETSSPQKAFMWTLQAAQNGSSIAQKAVATLYADGTGVEISKELALKWLTVAKDTEAKEHKIAAQEQVLRWLDDKASSFAQTDYQLNGLFSWQNLTALKDNIYNQPPGMLNLSRHDIYKPTFAMVSPKKIAIADYFDYLAPSINGTKEDNLNFPRYHLDSQIEALRRADSLLLQRPSSALLHAIPIYSRFSKDDSLNYIDKSTNGWEREVNYQTLLSKLYEHAILGDSTAQFELGQLYQYGIVVAKNPEQAIIYYQLSAIQQDLRAEYNLGILYLEGPAEIVNYQKGLSYLKDAAFKGNAYAQYALGTIYLHGITDANGVEVIAPDKHQAIAMDYLASANHYGPAEYRLAQQLVMQRKSGFNIATLEKRTKLIRRLYETAANSGVIEAQLPLAFYNAMDNDHKKQVDAYKVAFREAKRGNQNAALLLGMLYERGIAVPMDKSKAYDFYKKAGLQNPVTDFILGSYYAERDFLKSDLVKSQDLLQKAADAGFSYASLNLAVLRERNGESFVTQLDKARKLGNSKAGVLLADYYMSKGDSASDNLKAHDIYQYFADKGDKEGQLKLGYIYEHGLGVNKDPGVAAKWYTLAAKQNSKDAQYLLGRLYQLGLIESEPNYSEAKKWYLTAGSNYPKASLALGFIYDTVDDNYAKARLSYLLAADKNLPLAQFNLGLMYENGKGVSVNYSQAKKYYLQSASFGVAKAMAQLADIYLKGLDGKKDEKTALVWYRKAAALGNRKAINQLGLLSEVVMKEPKATTSPIKTIVSTAAGS